MNSIFESFRQWGSENLPDKLIEAIPHIVSALIILAVGFWISNQIGKLVVKILEKRGVDKSIHRFMQRSAAIFMKIIFSVIALEQLGISVNSFITALGAAGITAGLGLQDSISQFASGIQILCNKPFKAGDYIEIGGVKGKVKEIRFMYSTLVTNDNKIVVVPNRNITTSNLINYSAQDIIRLDLTYSISYEDDIAKAKKVLAQTASEAVNILKTPEPVIGVSEHGASGIKLAALVWCSSDNYWPAFFEMQESVKLAFDKNGIKIPYDQMDVHITKD